MKKILIGFILGGIIFGCIGVYAASYLATDIIYEPEDASWEVNNVSEALSDLYKSSAGVELKVYRSYDQTFSSTAKRYEIGFEPKLLMVGIPGSGALEWWDFSTNKHYYGAPASDKSFNLGEYESSGNKLFNIISVDETGFTVQSQAYNNKQAFIYAIGY